MTHNVSPKPTVGLLLGDPSGIGPELVAKLLADASFDPAAELIVIGDKRVLDREMERAGIGLNLQVRKDPAAFDPDDPAIRFLEIPVTEIDLDALPVGTANEIGGRYAMEVLTAALDLAVAKQIDAVAYAPMNKVAMNRAGWSYRDGIDFCTSHLGWDGIASELNVLDQLWVARVTSHVPMRRVHEHLTVDRIHAIIDLLKRSLIAAGVETPRIAVAGYNPHCGEGGLCGTEEVESIIPAIERAQSDGTQVSGPISADIVYIKARAGEFDGIVTMYHDQCQIANKLLEFDRGISIHGGTPVPTVTTAHGTAFDIVGTGRGNTQPLARAVAIAAKIAGNRDLYD
jgi:4-hydroxythreonine-4-phosphate dehydrogenase